jgi:hypothetical protein
MAVLFDPTDDYVSSVLEIAKVRGEIGLDDLESICEPGLEASDSIAIDDVGDTIEALLAMGIQIDNGLTEEEENAVFLRGLRDFVNRVDHVQLTGEAMIRMMRAAGREETRGVPPDPRRVEEEAMVREVLSKRTFVQSLLADLASMIRRERFGY